MTTATPTPAQMASLARREAEAAEAAARHWRKDALLWELLERGEISREERSRASEDETIRLVEAKYVSYLVRETKDDTVLYPSGGEVDWSYGD